MKRKTPEAILKKLRKAGRARAAQISSAERSEFGRKAWQTRLDNARKSLSPGRG